MGPTHDDITIESVAAALGQNLTVNDEMLQLSKSKMSEDLTEAQIKMATLPESCQLKYVTNEKWPILQCQNIFILPGVPKFFQEKILSIASHLDADLSLSNNQAPDVVQNESKERYKVLLTIE